MNGRIISSLAVLFFAVDSFTMRPFPLQHGIRQQSHCSIGRYDVLMQSSIHQDYLSSTVTKQNMGWVPEPVGLNLPELSDQDKIMLAAGEAIQTQERNGGAGTGVIVLDVPASPECVFNTLTKFNEYSRTIPTVRNVHIYSSSHNTNQAEFSVSRFKLKLNVKHRINKEQRIIHFNLDDSRPNLVLRQATGFWFVQTPLDRPDGYSRVFFKATVTASRLVPTPVVDYAAGRALTRATSWMQPHFTRLSRRYKLEEKRKLVLKEKEKEDFIKREREQKLSILENELFGEEE